MRRLIAIMGILTMLLPAVQGQSMNTLSRKEQRQGWQLLFDGTSTKGWHSFRNRSNAEAWKVQDGNLFLDATQKTGRGDIITDAVFEDFHFKFEWKIAPKGNSGIIFLSQERETDKATWHTGPEYQLIDNVNYPSKLDPRQMSGSLYDLIACPTEYSKPAGEWNSGEIRLEKGRLELSLNGKKAVVTTLWNEEWARLVAGSKFIKEKDFAKSPSGRIALQDHGASVWLRNLKIKPLR